MIILYGIPNCDTIKKALNWFKVNKIAIEFYDYKKHSVSQAKLKSWIKQVGYDVLINKKSATWRALSLAEQQAISNHTAAIALMMKHTSVIKRPVVEIDEKVVMIGFSEEEYATKFSDEL